MNQATDSPRQRRVLTRDGLEPDQLVSQRYRVIRRIGAGAYGTVYEVEHVALSKRFALKVLNAQAQRNWRAIARFQAEAVTASKIDHPHIVSVTDVGQTEDDQAYYVMELLEGETLAAVLKRESGKMLSLSRAIPILAATAHGLHAAHEAGVVHRDLKPENIFLVPQEDVQLGITKEVVRILDFGLAKVLEAPGVTVEGITYGTPGYMAPEQIRGDKIDRRADLYSIGCIAYEMLAGRPLYIGSAMDVAMAHIEQEPAPLTEAPSRRMRRLVERCLKKDPGRRFQTGRELLEELRVIAIELLTPDGQTRQIEFGELAVDSSSPALRDSYPNLDPARDDSWWDEFSSIARRMGGPPSAPEITQPLFRGPGGADAAANAGGPDEESFGGETLIDGRSFGEIHQDDRPSAPVPGKPPPTPGPFDRPARLPTSPPGAPERAEPRLKAPQPSASRRLPQTSDNFFPVENTLQVDHGAGMPALGEAPAWGPSRLGWYALIGSLVMVLLLLGLLTYRVLSSGKPTGALIVNIEPEGAELAIDGTVRPGSGAFRVINDLPAGRSVVTAAQDGCAPVIRQVKVEKGRVQLVKLQLECGR